MTRAKKYLIAGKVFEYLKHDVESTGVLLYHIKEVGGSQVLLAYESYLMKASARYKRNLRFNQRIKVALKENKESKSCI